MKKYNNNPIKAYTMGNYKYEHGTQFAWQKEVVGVEYMAKSPRMTKEELSYWQNYFHKKYQGNFASRA